MTAPESPGPRRNKLILAAVGGTIVLAVAALAIKGRPHGGGGGGGGGGGEINPFNSAPVVRNEKPVAPRPAKPARENEPPAPSDGGALGRKEEAVLQQSAEVAAEADCAAFYAAAGVGAATDTGSAEAVSDLKDRLGKDVVNLASCRAFMAKSDEPCKSIKDATLRDQCVEEFAGSREFMANPEQMEDKMVASLDRKKVLDGVVEKCLESVARPTKDECAAYRDAITSGDPNKCTQSAKAIADNCKMMASGDYQSCPPEDDNCLESMRVIAIVRGGKAALEKDPEFKRNLDLVKGKMTCDELAKAVAKDCGQKVVALRNKAKAGKAN